MSDTPTPAASPSAAAAGPSADDLSDAQGHGHGGDPARSATRFEIVAVVIIGLAMVALPTIEAVWRRFTGNSMPGAAVYTQHFTLWIGFIGAMIATASKSHLALSTLDMIPPGRARVFCQGLASVLSAFINAALAYASLIMVLAQRGSTNVLEGGVPAIVFEAVMPIAFTVMAYRFAKQSTSKLARILGFAAVAVVVPFILGAFLSSYGHPVAWLTPPDFSAIFGSHRSLFVWPAALALFVGFLMGMPVFVAMAGCAMLLFYVDGTVVASVPTETFSLVQQPSLPAIPLLTIAGYLLAEGGASKRLVRAAQAWFGWMPGGLAVVTVVVCAVFTTFTGASGVTILALGGILLPALKEEGYPEGFAVGNLTASGSLGLLFPPSLPVILYGVVAGVAIDHLYIAGLLPGLVMIILVAAYGIYMGVKNKTPQHAFALKDALAALWGAKWDLGLPVLVMVVVKSGFATIVEAAALGAAYAILVELIVFRDIHPFRDLPKVLGHAAALVGSVVILLGMAMGLTNYLVDAEIPTALLNYVQSHIHSQWAFLLALNVILLVLGSVLEIYSAIVVLAPLIVPLGKAFNVEPLHLGVVFLANLELGFLFPPMGLNLLLAATRFKKPLPYLYKQALPFLVIMAIGVLLITYVPAITTGVVYALKGGP